MGYIRIFGSVAGVGANTPFTVGDTPGAGELVSAMYINLAGGTIALRTIVTGVPAAGQARIIAAASTYGNCQVELGDAIAAHGMVVLDFENPRTKARAPWP